MSEEVKLLYRQLVTTCLYVLVFIFLTFLTYNKILKKTHRTPFIGDDESSMLFLFVNVISFILILSNLYVNYKFYELDDTLSNELQFYVSILSVIGSIVVIYSILISNNNLNIDF